MLTSRLVNLDVADFFTEDVENDYYPQISGGIFGVFN
jgi:hypothetical protein